MPVYRTEDIRNITLVGHTGSGKTTLVEALLTKTGQIGEPGTIERGTTTTDHDPLEKEFQHSLDSAIASFDHEGTHVNMIDVFLSFAVAAAAFDWLCSCQCCSPPLLLAVPVPTHD